MNTAWVRSLRRFLGPALIVTRREVIDQLRDWRIIAPGMVLTLFFPLLMNFTANEAVRFVAQYGAAIVGERLIPFLLMVVGFFPSSFSLVIALEIFVGEKERHSLEPLLSSPLTDAQLYVGKVLAAMCVPLLGSYLGVTVYLTGLAVTIHWYAPLGLLTQILILTAVHSVVMVSGAVVLSAQTTSARAANLLASFIIIPVALLLQGESIIMFWGMYGVLWWVAFGLTLLAVVLVRMGVKLFNREELLGREIDEINFRAAWLFFKAAFVGRGQGRGLLGWYRTEIPATLRRLAAPLLVMGLAVSAAMILGAAYAPVYHLPLSAADLRLASTDLSSKLEVFGMASPLGAGKILLVNLRALALASILGMFSLGVLSIILLMVPLGLMGFFAGQMSLAGISPGLFLLAFFLPHGIFETPAALLCGASILRLGTSILAPPPGKTVGAGWLAALADWFKVSLALVLPLLILAALAEALVTPRVVELLFGG